MPRPKNVVPTYSKHPRNNTARAWIAGRWVSLGRYNSPESRAEFARLCAELAATSDAATSARSSTAGPTVAEVIAAFKEHAEAFYRKPDGTPTGETKEYQQALRIVRELYGHTQAREFGPVALKTVRTAMVAKGWCRSRVNRQVGRVRRVWKWAAAEEMVPGSLVHDLACLAGLRTGRSAAHETEPVGPAPEAAYRAALPHMTPTLRAMVQVQRLAGLRPCEVRLLTPADLDTSGELWIYAPAEHKMSHLGRTKAVPLPPSARAVIEPWLAGREPDQVLFSPRQAQRERFDAMRAARKSKVQPSQLDRSKPMTVKVRQTRERYTRFAYGQAVRRACERAGVEPWTPGQLRHSFATEVRAKHGLEAAQVLLGHKKADVTQVYAEATLAKGIEAARAMG
ncbi:tyrosine-type recombinase/integrase [Urbifossiella limnaea]|uniref:Tyrosine recombinase XerC n=1 Tax=Urbifossiella limnaea TaxID=2528023 RepID=A0A517Y1H4_9BACT|nr:tyrosine-type recombinase/integrase [Urbifossiella limnaea]QDU23595.1 Tyrosine recombinase XerC [Urbifossiella limnaea]